MALMLISGTGLLLRSFVNLLSVDTGFKRDHVMVMQMFAWDRNPGPVALRSFLDRVVGESRLDSRRRAGRRGAGDAVHRIEHRHPGADAAGRSTGAAARRRRARVVQRRIA